MTVKNIKTTIVIIVSALLSAFSINYFVHSGQFYPGGFSGISILLIRVFRTYFNIELSYGLLYMIFNIGPTLLVYRYVGQRFTFFSIMHILLVSLFTMILPKVLLEYDIILITIFGGLIAGMSIVLSLQQDASGGGTDFIAIYVSNRFHKSAFNYIFYGNLIVLSIAGLLFGWEHALYSVIYQFVVTQMIEQRYLRYKHSSLFIITEEAEAVCASIFESTRHGITKIMAEGAYTKKPKTLLYMVVNAFEVQEVITAAKKADPKVFISISKTDKIVGNYYLKPME